MLGAAARWGAEALAPAAWTGLLLFVALAAPRARVSRKIFVAVGAGLAIWALTREGWPAMLARALETASFVLAFFVALAWLRNAAATSPGTARAGRYLAHQLPGRRYLALTGGGHLFGLVLSYGAIQLLGGLAARASRKDADPEVRAIRLRRMLLAIQRGFVGTLAWSPLTYSIAITTTVVPGADWAAAVPFCLVSAAGLMGIGYALDTIVKPRLSGPRPPPQRSDDTMRALAPLVLLLAVLVVAIGTLQFATGLQATTIVMLVVPLVSLGWVAVQAPSHSRPWAFAAIRTRHYVEDDLPGYRSELLLLVMAGFIGTLGSELSRPLVEASGLDLAAIPAPLLLAGLVWLVPLTGQLGMNPILAVSLIAPLLPAPAALGVPAEAVVVALTGGWALSGASSPYTATTLLIGGIGGVPASRVGVGWNGVFVLVAGLALSVWAVTVAAL